MVKIATIPFFPREPYGCFAYLAAKSKCKDIISIEEIMTDYVYHMRIQWLQGVLLLL